MALITKQAIEEIWYKSSRAVLGRHRVPFVRWVRSHRKKRRLRRADVVVVSFAKSGRTWLRVMMSRLFQTKYALPEQTIIERDNLHRLNRAIPVFLFTHNAYTQAGTQAGLPAAAEASPYYRKRLIFLARHPADTAVSYYFHARNRVNPLMKDVKGLPDDLTDTSMFEFVSNERWGMPAIIRYLNDWADGLAQLPRSLLVCYEDLHLEPVSQLRRIADFMGEQFEDGAYDEAVEFASFERLQQKEREGFFANHRLKPRDASNPESFKVRRGKVGGYRDYFTDEEVAWIEQQLAEQLDPVFGYGKLASADARNFHHAPLCQRNEA